MTAHSIAKLEWCLEQAAYVVVTYGAVYAPLLDRIERELALAMSREDSMARARAILARRAPPIDAHLAQPLRQLPAPQRR